MTYESKVKEVKVWVGAIFEESGEERKDEFWGPQINDINWVSEGQVGGEAKAPSNLVRK